MDDCGELEDGTLVRCIAAAGASGARPEDAEVYRRYAPRVRVHALRWLREADAAEDHVQRVLLTVLTSLREGRLREPDRLDAFVLGTSRLVLRDDRRAERRHHELLTRFAGDLAPPEVDPPVVLYRRRLAECLGQLSERERAILTLAFWMGSTAEESARAVGVSAANVRVIRHRAIARLSRCVAGGELE